MGSGPQGGVWGPRLLPAGPQPAPSSAGSRVPSIENVLQDGSPEPCSRGQPSAAADIYLPGNGTRPVALGACQAWGKPTSPSLALSPRSFR